MRRLGIALAVVLALVGHADTARADDCQGVMAALFSARQDAQGQMEVVDALEHAIYDLVWDPDSDGWMVDALDAAIDDLIGYLNAAALAEERAHAAHCYQ